MAEPAGPGPSGHYFEPSPSSRSARREIRLDLPDISLTLHTDRGVFSPDRIDTGTKHLLLDGPTPARSGTLVDLGCGYGAIACALARRSPGAEVWAIEVNERALELCRSNAERLGLANVRVAAPDAVPRGLVVDELWSNPPIRIGKEALHDLLRTWMSRLSPAGRALLVVQKHLGADSLHRWLEDEGHGVDRLRSRAGYRLLEVRPT
jgi:16S rRNA (guanine1207-N2)-methyltransferase